ncbi:hypothetical protein ACFWYW_23950 [Nonomuraea sp. NPDC059023]|uniref:hypothetical protein n=1 Tax=unclassified Nonomuraea TaxID=2593643 RepID=UPI00369AD244
MPPKKKGPADPNLNPITGQPANTFTATTGRALPRAVNAKQFEGPAADATRMRRLHREVTAPGGSADAQLGYRRPEGMSHADFTWLAGGHRMFPNTAAERGSPAINQPHEHHPEITVQRRAEDLTGPEYRKGEAVLAHYGHDPRNPIGSLEKTHHQALDRVMAEHIQAGVNESGSQMFYGGRPTTRLPDADLQKRHDESMMSAYGRLEQAHHNVMSHQQFADNPVMARAVTNQAVADTSPNSKWRSKDSWPNIEQAEEAVSAAVEGRDPRFISGRKQNNYKVVERTLHSLSTGDPSTHHYGDPYSAAKTIAFRGALADKDHADAYKVSDIHEASVVAPGLPTSKSKMYTGADGKKFPYYADQPVSAVRGATPVIKTTVSEKTGKVTEKHDTGNSRPEQMLSDGKSYVHALNDYATRRVAAERGLSRGVNYADNAHTIQAAAWGSQQMRRADVMVSHADQYPVVRDWASEGAQSLSPEWSSHFGEHSGMHLGAQFRPNPNTKINTNPSKDKPYPVMPGD